MTDLALEWTAFLKHQYDFFNWEPPGDIKQTIEGIFGGWGSGKSVGAARRAFKLCCQNSWRPEYQDGAPIFIVAAPTLRVLKQATMDTLEKAIPRLAIRKKRGAPHYEWQLVNGVRILFTSGESEMEGISAFGCLIDEIQHEVFSTHPKRYLNYLARLRDPLSSRRAMIVAGIPESGWVRDTFDRPDDPSFHTVLCATRDNHHIPKEMLQRFLSSCPSGYEQALLEGNWMAPPGAIYSQYDSTDHLTSYRGSQRAATHIGMDVGNGGAVVFAQETLEPLKSFTGHPDKHGKGLIVVDEMLTNRLSVEEICLRIHAETTWRIVEGASVIHVDPNTDRDELRALRKYFPGVRIVRRERGHDTYSVDTGIRHVQAGLRDAWGNIRLRFWEGLRGRQYGVLDGIERYRRNPVTQKPVKDNLRDHVTDALRYLVAEQLPLEKSAGTRLIKG